MRNLKLLATVIFVAVLLVGVVFLLRQTSAQNDTSVTTTKTTQVDNQQLAATRSTDPPKKKVRVSKDRPLYINADQQLISKPLKASKRSTPNSQASKIQGKDKLKVIQEQNK